MRKLFFLVFSVEAPRQAAELKPSLAPRAFSTCAFFPVTATAEFKLDVMGKKNKSKDLSHEEIWDDSALVRSWDEAVEEYKVCIMPNFAYSAANGHTFQLYHSIQARGENVEEVLGRAESLEATNEDGPDHDEDAMDTENATSRATIATDLDSSVNAQRTRQTYGVPQVSKRLPCGISNHTVTESIVRRIGSKCQSGSS